MKQIHQYAYAARWMLLIGGIVCVLAAFTLYIMALDGDPISLGILAVFFITQWLFLLPRRGWSFRLVQQGRPMELSIVIGALISAFVSPCDSPLCGQLVDGYVTSVNDVHPHSTSPKHRHPISGTPAVAHAKQPLSNRCPEPSRCHPPASHGGGREWQFERGNQMARECEVSVVPRVDHGLDLPGWSPGTRHLEIDDCFLIYDLPDDHRVSTAYVSTQRVGRRISDPHTV